LKYLASSAARQFIPTLKDFEEWLEGSPDNLRHDMQQRVFEAYKGIFSFTRQVNENNDIGLEAYIRLHLDSAYFAEYQNFLVKGKE
jgi:hypothetical protein